VKIFQGFLFLVIIVATHPLQAASVIWGTPQGISSDTDVSEFGLLLYAYTFGSEGVPATSVNGVTFQSFGVPDGSSSTMVIDDVSLAISENNSFFTNNDAGYDSGAFAALPSDYQELLMSGISTSEASGVITLTLGGLTSGQIYAVQFWSNDSSGGLAGVDSESVYTAGNAVELDDNTMDANGGVGQWVIGAFTADSVTQVFTIQSSPTTTFPALNAFQLRAIPEPTCGALLGLGAVVIYWQLRRRIA